MVFKKIRKFSEYYLTAHSARLKQTHFKWRTTWILFVVVLVLFVNDYLQSNYSVVIEANGKARYLPETLFNWFMTGVAFGILALAVLNEGEFILSLRKLVRQIEVGVKEKISETGSENRLGKIAAKLNDGEKTRRPGQKVKKR